MWLVQAPPHASDALPVHGVAHAVCTAGVTNAAMLDEPLFAWPGRARGKRGSGPGGQECVLCAGSHQVASGGARRRQPQPCRLQWRGLLLLSRAGPACLSHPRCGAQPSFHGPWLNPTHTLCHPLPPLLAPLSSLPLLAPPLLSSPLLPYPSPPYPRRPALTSTGRRSGARSTAAPPPPPTLCTWRASCRCRPSPAKTSSWWPAIPTGSSRSGRPGR